MQAEEAFQKATHRVRNVINALVRDGANADDVISAMLYGATMAAREHGATQEDVNSVTKEVFSPIVIDDPLCDS